MMRIGGLDLSMVRICTGLVWVRKTFGVSPSAAFMKKVSWVSRAGWSGGKFSAVKL